MAQYFWVSLFQENNESGDTKVIYRIYYHALFLLLSTCLRYTYRRLEIQVDFFCQSCRSFLENVSAGDDIVNGLTYLKVHVVNFHDGHTIGLYVHCIKLIFRMSTIQFFEIASIPSQVFEELKLWFIPDNIYFSKIRPFAMFLNQNIPNCMLFKFKGIPND